MKNLLLQLDTDTQPSTFDSVVAIDSGADVMFRHGGVTTDQVEGLVHGLIFTRAPSKLKHSAIYVGGSNVDAAEELLNAVKKTFFGPMRVSVMMDGNGANTTAAAAVICGGRHLDLKATQALVLGGTGPVGQRAARLLIRAGASVRLASRSLDKAQKACQQIAEDLQMEGPQPVAASDPTSVEAALQGVQLLIAAGAAGVTLVPQAIRQNAQDLKVAIDLNAVPPVGLEGVDSFEKAVEKDGQICYGAIGVGGTKMAIHRAAIERLFQQNDLVLNAEEIYELGTELEG
ncbi:bifunctional NADP-dependent methylenetetrahydromethanopterin dehydrogenase/methylenetetrahydrofolate dehydrogenase [Bremerella cremea]|uniref:Bifunctional NADP-dependent methylenetetrahydromethanopterin dehydrogenase/methylenetetrahydrofolate dehydrogenase n=1 Tax=Blastopirellula marina TaxID=124 RepID=A0A2S8G6L9_9BACT|nr:MULTISPECIES: methylene-tetrahydromethanopterin dehydrogenase N-terminal domain-containing protein [Pirellulaceae]PQO39794.1 bifunctional NADP-dependent methylenetetrahydromethanopterin dehydrogenase/methylenetetrahydrofolate dehydrogenase [Blastopirellula marina]RCS51261.1 bifunctional NADP-dependent methylenetetrahydromethanopterin dehydrogenase/methylenetetrahydrofolate dehydrogenase [Bremerella cremea]